jgi:hypothetical protein
MPPEMHAQSSGQIDLRPLVEAYQRRRAETPELTFEIAAPMPILTPAPARAARPPIWLLATSAFALVAATVAVTLIVIQLRGHAEIRIAVAVPGPATPATSASPHAAAEPAAPVEPIAVAQPVALAVASPAAADEASATDAEPAARSRRATATSPVSTDASDVVETVEATEPAAAPESTAIAAEPTPAPADVAPAPAAPPSAPATTAAVAEAGSCDELSCLVDPSAACCKKSAPAAANDTADTSDRPAALSRDDIATGLAPVLGRIESCGDKHGFSGAAPIKLRIAADGSVRSASTAVGTPEFRACIAERAALARFAVTRDGVTIRYPVVIP